MNLKESVEILNALSAAYPNFKFDSTEAMKNAAKTWATLLSDYTFDEVKAGVYAFIRTNTSAFAPSIGQVIDEIDKLATKDTDSLEAWSMVRKAMSNSSWHAKEEYDKLPTLVQKAVGSMDNLYQWAMSDVGMMETIEAHFLQAYQTVVKRDREERKLPQELKRMKVAEKEVPKLEQNNYEEQREKAINKYTNANAPEMELAAWVAERFGMK